MNSLVIFALCVAYASASVIGHGHGTVVSGPSGIVTDHGAIGPVAVGHGVHGLGSVVSGPAGIVTSHGAIGPVSAHGAGWGGVAVGHGLGWGGVVAPSAIVSGHGLGLAHGGIVSAHGLSHGGIVSAHGLGLGLSHGGIVAGHGLGLGLAHGHGVGGVVVNGPHTAPAVIAGPSGKIVADGLWGPTNVWNSHHGHHGW